MSQFILLCDIILCSYAAITIRVSGATKRLLAEPVVYHFDRAADIVLPVSYCACACACACVRYVRACVCACMIRGIKGGNADTSYTRGSCFAIFYS